MKIDDWFKSALMVLVIIFLIIFYQYSQNGRYTYVHDPNSDRWAVDSRTGTLYGASRDEAIKVEMQLGKITISPMQRNNLSSK
jgi:hypothetical protein